ncbi:hypothetical protein [Capnocytophaga granulosa]|uniref:hypothetical protein n=1 Tax=Capnocytophaga granulosa TaxID=45242 RepID=UPI0028E2E6D8|nr:hypothetical protein [Capnocytophaga granulosa]
MGFDTNLVSQETQKNINKMILFKKLLLHTLKIWPFLYKIQTEPHYKKWKFVLDWGAPLLLISLVLLIERPTLKEYFYGMFLFLILWGWVLYFIRKAMNERIKKGYQYYLKMKEDIERIEGDCQKNN